MASKIRSFEAIGIELEYMIVDLGSFSVRPCADAALRDKSGAPTSDVIDGAISWSNELAAHVIELKTTEPARSLNGLAARFHESLLKVDALLSAQGAGLLPSAMHPTMDPVRESALWAHESSEVYDAYHRIFDCRGHGWTNLQSMHINLPFSSDEEFGRLHAATRALLPILPGLAASSPFEQGKFSGFMDRRLVHYQRNQAKVPEVAGSVIPEPAWTPAEYSALILEPIYRAIEPFDPEGTLRHEWLNSRGAIARFDRNAIEIRVMDVQECPASDIALAKFAAALAEGLANDAFVPQERLRSLQTEPLKEIFDGAVKSGSCFRISDPAYLSCWGIKKDSVSVRELTSFLLEKCVRGDLESALGSLSSDEASRIELIVNRGTLAERMLSPPLQSFSESSFPEPHARPGFAPSNFAPLFLELRRCLLEQRPFA